MTSLQKTCIVSLATILTGTGIYEALKVTRREAEVQALRLQQGPLVEKLQQLQSELRDTTNHLFEANRRLASLSSIQNMTDLLKLRGEVGLLRRQLAVLKTEADSRAAGYPRMLSDPATKQMMHQANVVGLQSMYAPLFAELKLKPAEVEKATRVIADVVEAQSEKWFVLPQGSLSPNGIAQAAAERESEWEKRLRPLLGEEGWTRFREFQAEIPAKATAALLDADLGGNQLDEEQRTKLVAAIKAEPFELTRGVYGDWDPAFWGSQDYIDHHLAQLAESNKRILQQAKDILHAEQVNALATVLSNGIMTRVTMANALIRKP